MYDYKNIWSLVTFDNRLTLERAPKMVKIFTKKNFKFYYEL